VEGYDKLEDEVYGPCPNCQRLTKALARADAALNKMERKMKRLKTDLRAEDFASMFINPND